MSLKKLFGLSLRYEEALKTQFLINKVFAEICVDNANVDVMCFKVNFESDIRSKYLELLGYNKEELALKVRHVICSSACEI